MSGHAGLSRWAMWEVGGFDNSLGGVGKWAWLGGGDV